MKKEDLEELEELGLLDKINNFFTIHINGKEVTLKCENIMEYGEALLEKESGDALSKATKDLEDWARNKEIKEIKEVIDFIKTVRERLFPGVLQGHLGASGIYKIWEGMKKETKNGGDKLLVIAEFREEMGSFRNKVAKLLNDEFKRAKEKEQEQVKKDLGNLHCFTSDIGMAIHFEHSSDGKETRSKIQCSICRHDNDLYTPIKDDKPGAIPYPRATFHQPEDITEVCIKGDSEAMVYLCQEHDTGPNALFLEHLDRYDLFNSEGVPL